MPCPGRLRFHVCAHIHMCPQARTARLLPRTRAHMGQPLRRQVSASAARNLLVGGPGAARGGIVSWCIRHIPAPVAPVPSLAHADPNDVQTPPSPSAVRSPHALPLLYAPCLCRLSRASPGLHLLSRQRRQQHHQHALQPARHRAAASGAVGGRGGHHAALPGPELHSAPDS